MLRLYLFLLGVLTTANGETFRFANMYGDYMVLQQSPYRSQIWGYSTASDDKITVTVTNTVTNTVVETLDLVTDSDSIWLASFSPVIGASDVEYSITVTSSLNSGSKITLSNLLFGDVYICSGQSNMQFSLNQAFNASQEIQDANNYPNIRIFTASPIGSDTPQIELLSILEEWNISTNITVDGPKGFSYFSAVCWLFGRNLYNVLQYPIGLIATDYGGTPIRLWMPSDTLSQCNESISKYNKNNLKNKFEEYIKKDYINTYGYDKIDPSLSLSSLYNAMIYPFLQTTIKGAIWYQGEADSKPEYSSLYSCAFPLMINSWRQEWGIKSDSDLIFPFGFVQLSTWNDGTGNKTCGNNDTCTVVAKVRYGQTANYGYVPNPKMINTFMATAIDLGDPTSPYGDVHSRYKIPVGKRLSDAALNVVYGYSEVYWMGPIAEYMYIDNNSTNINIAFRNVGDLGLDIKNQYGFEVYNSNANTGWTAINSGIILNGDFKVTLQLSSMQIDATNVKYVRYNWYQAPCLSTVGPYNCAIYDKKHGLPATPFMLEM